MRWVKYNKKPTIPDFIIIAVYQEFLRMFKPLTSSVALI